MPQLKIIDQVQGVLDRVWCPPPTVVWLLPKKFSFGLHDVSLTPLFSRKRFGPKPREPGSRVDVCRDITWRHGWAVFNRPNCTSV